MGGPEDTRLPARQRLTSLTVKRRVPPPSVDAHDTHALIVEPSSGLGCHAAAAEHIVWPAIVGVAASPHQHNVERLEYIANPHEVCLRVGGGHRVAFGPSGHIENHAVAEEPLQRQLVDRLGALALDVA